MNPPPISWSDQKLTIIDQTLLPVELTTIHLARASDVWEAIKMLRVRGAPAIGICAAYGVLVGVIERSPGDVDAALGATRETVEYLASSRPTAVNLFWALDRLSRAAGEAAREAGGVADFLARIEAEAVSVEAEEEASCRAIGEHGLEVISAGDGILTHCNAGALATGAHGTALSPMIFAKESGVDIRVYADETRPLLQGARLTTWELMGAGVPVTLICDNMAAQVMREGRIQLVIVGADRIASNGDAANKIGTYSAAVLAKAHGVPFYVAAPLSTVDFSLASGEEIPIELRDPAEVTHGFGRQTAPDGVEVYNPAFDVTPAELIAGIITEKGVLRPPYTQTLAAARHEKASAANA